MINTKQIVSKIVNGFKTSQLWDNNATNLIPESGMSAMDDPKKPLKATLTDIVVQHYLKTNDQQANFIKLVYQTFENAINDYIKAKNLRNNSIRFIYKGGNTMRFVAISAFNELPGKVTDDLAEYRNYFKKSDADFSIYIDPSYGSQYNTILEDMISLAYIVQFELRAVFMADPANYFNFYELNKQAQEKILLSFIEKLNDTDTIKEKKEGFDGLFTALMTSNVVAPSSAFNRETRDIDSRGDFEIIHTNPNQFKKIQVGDNLININTSQTKIIYFNKDASYQTNPALSDLYISTNRTLTFEKKDSVASFILVRTKVPFYAQFKPTNSNLSEWRKLDGELIDVSIPTLDDTDLISFYTNIDKYTIRYNVPSPYDFSFTGLTIQYLLLDLERVIFKDIEYPWQDSKYQKRINRIFLLSFIQIMVDPSMKDFKRLEFVHSLKKLFDDLDKKVTEDINSLKNLKGTLFELAIALEKFPTPYKNLLKYTSKMILDIINDPTDVDAIQVDEYFKILRDNIHIIDKAANSLSEYLNHKGVIEQKEVYESTDL